VGNNKTKVAVSKSISRKGGSASIVKTRGGSLDNSVAIGHLLSGLKPVASLKNKWGVYLLLRERNHCAGIEVYK
jgi:hypothetical protein